MTAVAVDEDLDLVASVSLDGTCIVHTLRAGLYTLTIRPPSTEISRLCHVAISSQGYLVLYSRSELRLYLYLSVAGVPLCTPLPTLVHGRRWRCVLQAPE